ncbi:MAG: MFS transporter [Alphaproteobacteria bacterium]|nr:MAG: MFS transporter [Alphaproteobacteria bacterium]
MAKQAQTKTDNHPADAKALARKAHAEAGDTAVGVVVGRTSEFFDFFVYAIASVLVFPKLVFPFADPLTAMMYSFSIFPLAFLARPFGTYIFSKIEINFGRGVKLTSSLFLLGTSTVVIAFLPGYDTLGLTAALLLAIFRIAQGLAWGGAWDGLPSLLSMHAPADKRGWYAMIPQLGAMLGLMVASALFAFFVHNLSAEDFYSWGWRYPFFVAFAINVVALFARLRIVSTPEYVELLQTRELQPQEVFLTIRKEWRNIWAGSFVPLASFALFHMVTVFPLSWVFLFTNENPARFLMIELGAAALGLVAVVASGPIADRIGRNTLLSITAGAIAAFSGFAPQLLAAGAAGEIVFMTLGFVILGLSFGQSSGVVADRFRKEYRYTASALTSDLAWLFGAGFAPLAALLLASFFGLMASGAYLLSGAIGTLVALGIYQGRKHHK